MDGVADAVAAGIGIAPLPAVLFEDPAFREVLTPILPDHAMQRATLYVVYASGKFLPLKVRTFVDFVVEFFSSVREAEPRLLQAPRRVHCRSLPEPSHVCAEKRSPHSDDLVVSGFLVFPEGNSNVTRP
jgi:hypothetical protein